MRQRVDNSEILLKCHSAHCGSDEHFTARVQVTPVPEGSRQSVNNEMDTFERDAVAQWVIGGRQIAFDVVRERIHAGGGGRDEFKIPLSRIMKRKAPDMALKADDILYVPDNNGKRMTNKVLNEIAGFGASTATGLLIYR